MCHVIKSDSGAGEKVSVIWETKWKKIKVRRDKWVTEATWLEVHSSLDSKYQCFLTSPVAILKDWAYNLFYTYLLSLKAQLNELAKVKLHNRDWNEERQMSKGKINSQLAYK